MPTDRQIEDALRKVLVPQAKGDLVSIGAVRKITECGGAVQVKLALPPAVTAGDREAVRVAAVSAVRAVPGVASAAVELEGPAPAAPAGVSTSPLSRAENAIPGVKNIVAVASGKGGVGKSTVSANLAVALARRGRAVGLIDVDAYGPSIPGILGFTREADGKYPIYADEQKKMIPPVQHGVRVISLGFFAGEDEATIVRGPIISQMVRQFIRDVKWGELDYLLCDLPPGTGDIPLTLAQLVPLTGVAIVATPQDVALKIAAKSITMFQKLRVDIVGIVENMSYFSCPHCQGRTEIFSHGGARKACDKYKVPFLGEIPLDIEVRAASDAGRPILVSRPDSPQAKAFEDVATRLEEEVGRSNERRAAEAPPLAPVTFVKTGRMEV